MCVDIALPARPTITVHAGGSDVRAPAAVTGEGTEVGAIGQIEDTIRVRELGFRRVVVIPTDAEDYPPSLKFFDKEIGSSAVGGLEGVASQVLAVNGAG
ncbi:MAG: hypothetical protein WKF37_17645 [Bryobacteraceae bacterium]